MKIIALTIIFISLSFNLIGQKKHSMYIGSGYSFSLKDGETKGLYGTQTSIDPNSGEVVLEDARPRLAEGINYMVGYEFALNEKWSLCTDFSYLDGLEWKRKIYLYPSFHRVTTTESQSIWWRVYLGFSIGKSRTYTDWDPFKERVSASFKIGPSLLKATVSENNQNSPGTLTTETYHDQCVYYGKVGLGLSGKVSFTYQLTRQIYLEAAFRADYTQYTATKCERTVYERFGREVNESKTYQNSTEFDFNNITPLLIIGYVLNP
ncbi:hypothetical protein [Owenweeksia hongkongensis]|uniref:hypothetical protein n=1 Tax=Owenweeksia hongkongensis TaxID=253245 RepID=UPI003A8F2389